jgi:hypothetical protein
VLVIRRGQLGTDRRKPSTVAYPAARSIVALRQGVVGSPQANFPDPGLHVDCHDGPKEGDGPDASVFLKDADNVDHGLMGGPDTCLPYVAGEAKGREALVRKGRNQTFGGRSVGRKHLGNPARLIRRQRDGPGYVRHKLMYATGGVLVVVGCLPPMPSLIAMMVKHVPRGGREGVPMRDGLRAGGDLPSQELKGLAV